MNIRVLSNKKYIATIGICLFAVAILCTVGAMFTHGAFERWNVSSDKEIYCESNVSNECVENTVWTGASDTGSFITRIEETLHLPEMIRNLQEDRISLAWSGNMVRSRKIRH